MTGCGELGGGRGGGGYEGERGIKEGKEVEKEQEQIIYKRVKRRRRKRYRGGRSGVRGERTGETCRIISWLDQTPITDENRFKHPYLWAPRNYVCSDQKLNYLY